MKRWVLFLSIVAACGGTGVTPPDKVIASPDQKHALVISPSGAVRSLDLTGSTVAKADHLANAALGTFSRHGEVLLTSDDAGHSFTFHVAGGAPVDLGSTLWAQISADGEHVAYLTNAASCTGAGPVARGALSCADLEVVSSNGGSPVKVASGIRLYVQDGGLVGTFDQWMFADDDHLLFSDKTGALFSVPIGSGAAQTISPSFLDVPNEPLPDAVIWSLLEDGSLIFYDDQAGTHVTGPDGKSQVQIAADFAQPSCVQIDQKTRGRCALTPDGKSLLLIEQAQPLVVLNGQPVFNPNPTPGFRLEVVPLADPAGAKTTVIDSPAPVFFANPAGGLVFHDQEMNLVARDASGAQTRILSAPGTVNGDLISLEQLSPGLGWLRLDSLSSSAGCTGCLQVSYVSTIDGTRWTVSDAEGPLPVHQAGWSPDGARVLVIGRDGTLFVMAASGGALTAVDQGVDDFTWIDGQHAVIQQAAKTSVRAIP
jgi:hypothetical protein